MHCLSVATGMKCLPSSKLRLAQGNVIHDWHAEVLAIRAFNRFILDECMKLALDPTTTSQILRRRAGDEIVAADAHAWHAQPFSWREDVSLHMYCSEAPCGDASMELTMAAQDDASPWDIPGTSASQTPPESSVGGEPSSDLLGRGFFSQLGVVRRKPARGDAPPTLSKSCSDKLSLKQCTSLLNSITALFVDPEHAYISTLVMPESQFSATGCARAFSADAEKGGRMLPLLTSPLAGDRDNAVTSTRRGGYRFQSFQVLLVPADSQTAAEFHYSKRSVTDRAAAAAAADVSGTPKIAASNLAVAWTRSGLEEATLGGVLQGRKQFDARGASFASRQKMWSLAARIADLLAANANINTGHGGEAEAVAAAREVKDVLRNGQSYSDIKQSQLLAARRAAKDIAKKEALKGWVRNIGDDGFSVA
ncbi:adenosine deaminase/editase [Microdochium bolleyi]|uniref:Adenosine deaminase/editase n=1 Tax=Microdochium bolleyi TaxID=196109 RepID=A0A136J9B7_9PEZI|nr:adenosine deaminase/editase [Microdochium bolleyi]